MKQFDRYLNVAASFMNTYFPDLNIEELSVKMRKEYEDLIPQLPHLGGSKNVMLHLLISSTSLLAIIRILEKEGISVHDIGEFCYNFYEKTSEKRRTFEDSGKTDTAAILLSKNLMFQKESIEVLKSAGKISQLRRYPEDWVYELVDGDGKTFDYGINFIECGICKFFKKQNAERFIPFMCMFDFVAARVSEYGFKRTQTLWYGASYCDFRYSKEGNTIRGWPLENLPEFRKK